MNTHTHILLNMHESSSIRKVTPLKQITSHHRMHCGTTNARHLFLQSQNDAGSIQWTRCRNVHGGRSTTVCHRRHLAFNFNSRYRRLSSGQRRRGKRRTCDQKIVLSPIQVIGKLRHRNSVQLNAGSSRDNPQVFNDDFFSPSPFDDFFDTNFDRRIDNLTRKLASEDTSNGEKRVQFSKEGSSSSQSAGRQVKSYYKESVIVYGPSDVKVNMNFGAGEAQLSGTASLLSPIASFAIVTVMLAAYISAGYRFYRGYIITSFQERFRWLLTLSWPILALFSDKFRQEFIKSIRNNPPENETRNEDKK